jgi:hypothetical protein
MAPLTYSDFVPVGLQYVANSASAIRGYISSYAAGDISAGMAFQNGRHLDLDDPVITQVRPVTSWSLQWRLQDGVTSPASGPLTLEPFSSTLVVRVHILRSGENEGCLKIDNGHPLYATARRCNGQLVHYTGSSGGMMQVSSGVWVTLSRMGPRRVFLL